jgi:hypothetical protein
MVLELSGCGSFPTPVGHIADSENAAKVVGYGRHYVVHATSGQIRRVDALSLPGDVYAITVAPGPHLIQLDMKQVSVMNPLVFGRGTCALVLDTAPRHTYQLRPPDFSTYRQFWSQPDLAGLVARRRFRAAIEVAIEHEGGSQPTINVPMDCQAAETYCRVPSDCLVRPGVKTSPLSSTKENDRESCVYEANFPLGVCSPVPGMR